MTGTTTWRRTTLAFVLALALVTGLLGAALGTAQAAAQISEKVKFDFTATQAAPGASGKGQLELRIDATADKQLNAEASGNDLRQGRYSLCVGGVFVVDGTAVGDGSLVLKGKLVKEAVTVSTLDSLVVTIHEGDGCAGTVVLTYTVTAGGGPAPAPQGQEVRFKGIVVSISGGPGNIQQWRIGDFLVVVDEGTRLDDEPEVGSKVEVRAVAQPDGTALATQIKNLTPNAAVFPGPASGPGYGVLLTVSVDSAVLLLDREGQTKEQPGQKEVKNRQYEGTGPFEVGISVNGDEGTFMANEIKIVSNLKLKGGVGQQQGTVDIDIDAIPGGHITLEYKGSATMTGGTITSGGTFKVAKVTGDFALIRSEGTYVMTIVESGNTFGSPATVTFFASGQ